MKRNDEKRSLRNLSRGTRRRAGAWLSALLMLFTMLPTDLAAFAEAPEEVVLTYCGLEEHVHTASCYEDGVPVCGLEEHLHTPECYVASDELPGAVEIKAEPVENAKKAVELDLVDDDAETPTAVPTMTPVAERVEEAKPEATAKAAPQPEAEADEAALAQEDAPSEAVKPAAALEEAKEDEPDEAVPGDFPEAVESGIVEAETIENETPEEEIIVEEKTDETETIEENTEENIEETEAEETAAEETPVEDEAAGEAEEAITEDSSEEIAEAEAVPEETTDEAAEEIVEEVAAEEVVAEEVVDENIADEAAEVAEVVYPAQRFEERAFNVAVTANAPEGAFPEGTAMRISRVWDSDTLSDIRDTVADDFVEVKRVTAVDITFLDASGVEIEPLKPIEVSIAVADIRDEQSAVVVHVDDDGNAELVEQAAIADAADTMELTVEMPASELSFEADAFSIYAVVVTETIETRYIAADGETYNIKLTYGPEANIPAGAALEVREVAKEDYIDRAEAALPEGERVEMARFFDIAIVSDGVEIEPAAPVEVSIALDETAEGGVRAVHFEDGGDVTLIDAEQAPDGVVFSADSFSVYGVVYYTIYTKDGDATYAITGEDKTFALSELLEALGKPDLAVTDVTSSVPDSLSAAQDGDDWKLTVVKPFEDSVDLTLAHEGGPTTVTLTSAIRAWSITDLLDAVEIYDESGKLLGTDESETAVKLSPDKSYRIRFHFAEKSGHQFSDNGVRMFYDVPEGVSLDQFKNALPQDLPMSLDDGAVLTGNMVSYDEATRRIYIQWNTADPNFELLTDAANAEFELNYWVNVDDNLTKLIFRNGLEIEVEPDDSYEPHVEKEGIYNRLNDTVDYTVTVWADGTAKDIAVSDAIGGTALKYKSDSLDVKLYPEEGEGDAEAADYAIVKNLDDEGFSLKIKNLPNDKKAVITYAASVDYGKLTGKGTVSETANHVKVTGSGLTEEKDNDMADGIDYVSLDKISGDFEVDEATGMLLVPWTIKYNQYPKVSVAGATLTDRITSGDVDTMWYATDKPFVVVRHAAGVEDAQIVEDWSTVDVTNYNNTYADGMVSVTSQSWTWTVPEEPVPEATVDEETGEAIVPEQPLYWYEITYYTRVNPNHILMQGATLTNTVDEDRTHNHAGGWHDTAGIQPETDIEVSKKAVEVADNWTKWQVSFPRRKYNLVPAYLIDTHPSDKGQIEKVITSLNEAPDDLKALIQNGEAELIQVQGLKTGVSVVDAEGVVHENASEHVDVLAWNGKQTAFHFEVVDPGEGSAYSPVDFLAAGAAAKYTPVDLSASGTGLLALNASDGAECETITVTFYTRNSRTWIEGAMDGDYAADHTNEVELIANGQSVKASDTVTPDAPALKKQADPQLTDGEITPVATLATDGKQLPVYRFVLTLKGVNDRVRDESAQPIYPTNNWFDENDDLVITDTYGFYLRLLSTEELAGLKLGNDGYKLVSADGAQSVDVIYRANDDGTATFTIPKTNFEDEDGNVTFARKYTLTYYLVLDATDSATMDMVTGKLNEEGPAGDLTEAFTNSAEVNGIEAKDAIDFSADLKPISKTATKINDEKYSYRIVINPLGVTLNGGQPYRLTDAFENLAVDFSTMEIEPADGVKWTYHGNEGTFWIPDATAVTISYRAWPVGERGDRFTMKNTAEMMGYSDEVDTDVELAAEHSGSAHVYRLQLLKFIDDDMSEASRLANVTFQLYSLKEDGLLEKMHYKRVEIENEDGVVETVYHPDREAITFTTNANGMAKISLSKMKDGEVLEAGKQYYLKEVEAPDGYSMQDIYWSFVISDVSDYTAYVYRSNDVLKVSNSSQKAALILTKDFDTTEGGADLPYSDTKDIEFEIVGSDASGAEVFRRVVKYSDFTKYYPKSGVDGYYCYRLPWDDAEIAEATSFTVRELTETAEFTGYTRLTKIGDGDYSDVEDPSASLDKTANDDITVAFTNKYIPEGDKGNLFVRKEVEGNTDADKSYVFTIQGSEGYLQADGTLSETEVRYSVKAGATLAFNGIPVGSYTVTEILEGESPDVSATVNGEAAEVTENHAVTVDVAKQQNTDVTVTNTYTPDVTEFTFGKLWRNATTATPLVWPMNTSIKVAIQRRVGDVSDDMKLVYTISRGEDKALTAQFIEDESNTDDIDTAPTLEILDAGKRYNYQFKLSGLPERDADGNVWEYYAQELPVRNGFRTAYGVVDGFSAVVNGKWQDAHGVENSDLNQTIVGNIINKIETFHIDVPVKKKINGRSLKNGRDNLYDDEQYSFTLTYDPYYEGDTGSKTVVTTGANVAWFKDLAIVPTSITTDKVDGKSCVVFTFEYDITENERVDDKYDLGITNFDRTAHVTDVVAVAWESREIVEEARTRTVSATGGATGSATVLKSAKDADGGTAKQVVEIANKYVEETWKLRLRKKWDDAGNQDGLRDTLTFSITFTDANGDTTTREYTLKDQKNGQQAEFTPEYNVPKFINSIPIVKYEISEKDLTGYTVTWLDGDGKVVVDNPDGYDPSATVLNDKLLSGARLQVTNAHTPYTVDVSIEKLWLGDDEDLRPEALTMTLYVAYKGQAETKFNDVKADWGSAYRRISGTASLNADNDWAYTWEGLPKNAPGLVGEPVTYTVKEDNTAELPLGYYQSGASSSGYDNSITNTLALVDVTAKKVWEDDGNRDGRRDTVRLTLSATANNIPVKSDLEEAGYDVGIKEIPVDSDKNVQTVKWENLPERTTDGTIIKYEVTEASMTGYNTVVTTGNGYDFTVYNSHTYEKTWIKFTKTWAGDGDDLRWRTKLADYLGKLELRMNGVLLAAGEVKDGRQYLTTAATVSDSDRAAIEAAWVELEQSGDTYTVTWQNLPKNAVGKKISYTLAETAIDGYAVFTASGEATLTEGSDGSYTGALTNTRKTVNLRISKALVSDLAADKAETFGFTVTTDPKISGSFSGVAFTGGKSEAITLKFTDGKSEAITLKAGERITLRGLPTLVDYTVTEAGDARFTVKANGAEVASVKLSATDADADETLEAAFTNTRKTGDLIVSKAVDSPLSFDKAHGFQFRVTLKDQTISGEYGDMTFEKGVTTVTLSDGKSATAKGLPTDLEYTVEELVDDAAYFGYFAEVGPVEGMIATGNNTAAFTNTRVYAPVQLVKVDATDADKPLNGAEFILKWDGGSLKLVSDKTGALLSQESVSTDAVVAAKGSALMKLADGAYTLTETVAPDGYRKLVGEVKLTVKDFAVTVDIDGGLNNGVQAAKSNALTGEADVVTAALPNLPGAALPEAGGAGTAAYYLGGIGLLLLALYMMMKRRRAE